MPYFLRNLTQPSNRHQKPSKWSNQHVIPQTLQLRKPSSKISNFNLRTGILITGCMACGGGRPVWIYTRSNITNIKKLSLVLIHNYENSRNFLKFHLVFSGSCTPNNESFIIISTTCTAADRNSSNWMCLLFVEYHNFKGTVQLFEWCFLRRISALLIEKTN